MIRHGTRTHQTDDDRQRLMHPRYGSNFITMQKQRFSYNGRQYVWMP